MNSPWREPMRKRSFDLAPFFRLRRRWRPARLWFKSCRGGEIAIDEFAVVLAGRRGTKKVSESRESATSLTLLGRLTRNPEDQTAWREFEGRYGPKVRTWCRKWGLQDADADDVTQNVLLDLSRQMSGFELRQSGRFRSWLKTVAYRAWCDFLERRKRGMAGAADSAILSLLQSVEAREDFVEQLDRECELELLEEAMKRVQQRVQPHTWEAFRLMALERLPGAEVARRLEMKVGTVFVARSKVQKMLQEEARLLEEAP